MNYGTPLKFICQGTTEVWIKKNKKISDITHNVVVALLYSVIVVV